MTGESWTALRQLLVTHYDELARRLTRRLGSADLASDALQETFVRLNRPEAGASVANPLAYLLRTAINIASNQRRAQSRYLTVSEISAILDVEDEQPDPERAVQARSEIQQIEQALAGLSPRRREIFVAVLVDETPVRTLAERYGVSPRFVQMELKAAGEIVRAAVQQQDAETVLRLGRGNVSKG